ncbi:unnamed protein product [Calypogeia fissa]
MASTGKAMPSPLVVVGSAIYVEIERMPKGGRRARQGLQGMAKLCRLQRRQPGCLRCSPLLSNVFRGSGWEGILTPIAGCFAIIER